MYTIEDSVPDGERLVNTEHITTEALDENKSDENEINVGKSNVDEMSRAHSNGMIGKVILTDSKYIPPNPIQKLSLCN